MPIHRKCDKQVIQNYRPISLLPICGEIFEKLIFSSILKYLGNNNLINPHQSEICPGDSCVHQLLSITYDIYKSFDANPLLEVRGIFLDMSKAFERVWHEGLLFMLKRLGLCGKYYGINKLMSPKQATKISPQWSVVQWVSHQSRGPSGINFRTIVFLSIHR